MTNYEKREALTAFCKGKYCGNCALHHVEAAKCGRGKSFSMSYKGTDAYMTDDEIDAAYAIAFPGDTTAHIKDSGDRTEFSTGAVRDMREGKGRCDLMPLDVAAKLYGDCEYASDSIMTYISVFQETGDVSQLYYALKKFGSLICGRETMLLEAAKHFEDGAKKYGVDNWKKGIPIWCYIDSAVRHYLKWLRGDDDEHHDRAFVWNILCCIWTCEHKPELNDYAGGADNG